MEVAGFVRVFVVLRVTEHLPAFLPALIKPLGVTEQTPFAFHETFVFRSVGAGSTFEPMIERFRPSCSTGFTGTEGSEALERFPNAVTTNWYG